MDGPTAVRRVRFIALESETINVVRYSIQHLNLCGASAMKLSFMWSSKKTLQFKNEDVELHKKEKGIGALFSLQFSDQDH